MGHETPWDLQGVDTDIYHLPPLSRNQESSPLKEIREDVKLETSIIKETSFKGGNFFIKIFQNILFTLLT